MLTGTAIRLGRLLFRTARAGRAPSCPGGQGIARVVPGTPVTLHGWSISRLQRSLPHVTPTNPYDDEITSADEFERALGQLLTATVRNDVDPRGSWVYRSGDGVPDWEAMILELEKPESPV